MTKTKKNLRRKKLMKKKKMSKLFALCLCCVLIATAIYGCGKSNSSSSSDSGSSYTESDAISDAKSYAERDLCEQYELEFYSVDWGSSDAEEYSEGYFKVELNGNISGYKDKQKMDFFGPIGFSETYKVDNGSVSAE